ncbi:hypothetical protein KYC5002_25100 [Archangium violaceum]|uniref:hypothetical protein n=1 Tax=Archangium violaceum TaxID=83451 RepID=UPI002B2CC7E4|nr:hypothetical protein KYC5002_25100 [Archangium gephyra]
MPRDTFHLPFGILLAGLVLAACGGVTEAELVPVGEEPTGTREAALCSGLSVTDLTLNGISTYQGEMAGNGAWTVSTSSNAARLEFYVDGVLRSTSEEVGTPNTSGTISGTWFFSTTGIACGTRSFEVRAYPMVISSTGSRTTCYESRRTLTRSVTEACPSPPDAWPNCVRKTSTTVECTGTAQGGAAPYTAYWKVGSSGTWFAGSMTQTFSYALNTPYYFRVKDAAGVWSYDGYFCMCNTTACNICN